jgi:tetratricopeptide (TPR) repeat protein
MPSGAPIVFFRYMRSPRVLLTLLVLVAAAGFGGRHAWAWYQLREARAALARYHPAEAQGHLERCLRVWPDSVEVRLLSSRAARQLGDFDTAVRHLGEAQKLTDGNSSEVALEWALTQAAGGNTREVEEYLQRQADEKPESAALVWEALAQGYTRVYRILDAVFCLDHWLQLDPENVRALELRGNAYQTVRSGRKAADDYRRVLELDPARPPTRWRLVQCLLNMGSYEEALPLLHVVERERPGDPDVQVGVARCHNVLGRPEKARELLDAVVKAHPEDALALRTRGQFALSDSKPKEAEGWLRRGVKVWPNDYQTQWLLYKALQLQHKTAEADAQRLVVDAI